MRDGRKKKEKRKKERVTRGRPKKKDVKERGTAFGSKIKGAGEWELEMRARERGKRKKAGNRE